VVWAAAPGFDLHEHRPLPLATFNTDCFCRAWVCNALDAREIEYRIAYSSPSLSAIMAIVGAGLALTAQLQSLIPADLQILGEKEGLPRLPQTSIVLLRNPQQQSPVSETLAGYIADGFRL